MTDQQPTLEACPIFDSHYGSRLECEGKVDHDGPHFNGGATWPNGWPNRDAKHSSCPWCGAAKHGEGECGCIGYECGAVDARACKPGRVMAWYECEAGNNV